MSAFARVLFASVLVAVCLQYACGAPRAEPAALREDQRDLVQQFVEFLREDQQFAQLVGKISHDVDHLVRNRRQADDDNMNPEEFEPPQQRPGFFDRAAKFVTELLQRFLKWINSNDNN